MNILLPKKEKVTRDEARRQLKKANKELQKLNYKIRKDNMDEITKEVEGDFIDGFNQGKEFFADYITNWMESAECEAHMTPEGMEILRLQIETFNNED